MHYNLHRYYDPASGQYLSPDPLGLAGGLRTHAYVHDPLQWIDPWGLVDVNHTGKDGAGYHVYEIKDATGKTIYVGMTDDIVRREAEHRASGRLQNDSKMESIEKTKTYGEARGVEQYHIEEKGTYKPEHRGVYDSKGKIPAGAEGNRANSFNINRPDNGVRANAYRKAYWARGGKCSQ